MSLTDKIGDLCADSLEAASLIVELEAEFNIDIEGFRQHATLGDLLQFIEAKQ